MRQILKIISVALIVGCVAGAIQFLRLHDLGSRPQVDVVTHNLNESVQFIEANSLRFGYLEKGTGPLVLLLHGFPETACSWKAVQDQLADKGYRTVAVFMRGYAPTSLATEYSVRSLGKDIIALIEALGEEKAIIVGHDWGAIAAYEAAFIAPEMVSNLVAISIPHPRGTEPSLELLRAAPHFLYYQLPTAERLIWSDEFCHIRRIFKTWSPGFDMPEAEFTDIRKTMEVPGVINATLGYYHALFTNAEANAELTASDNINVPTLIISGNMDGTVPMDGFMAAEAAFTDRYAIEIITGVGHFPQIEMPEQVTDLILDFVTGE